MVLTSNSSISEPECAILTTSECVLSKTLIPEKKKILISYKFKIKDVKKLSYGLEQGRLESTENSVPLRIMRYKRVDGVLFMVFNIFKW